MLGAYVPDQTMSEMMDITVRGHGLEGRLVTIFGGGGFVGRHVAQAAMRAGARVRVVQRRPLSAVSVRALGNLGQIHLVAADATQAAHVHRAVQGSDLVVNLVGSFANMMAVHADAAGAIAGAARAAGVSRLVHMSAIGADAGSPSLYGRSKAAGEAAVAAGFGGATIVRPSIIFGRDDQFINRFAGLISSLPVVPVIAPETRFQPVHVADVADAIVHALGDDGTIGATYELGGPQILSMRALLEWIAATTGRSPRFVTLPAPIAGAMASLTGWLPGAPITRDQWLMLGRDNVVAGDARTIADLGIVAAPLDAVAPGWLDMYRSHGRFSGKLAS